MQKLTFLLFILAIGLASAADQPVGSPSLGYLSDAAGVRLVYGIPGAAQYGPPLDLGGAVRAAAVSNRAGYALASVGDEGRVVLVQGSVLPLEGALAAPDRIVVSPRGRAAAFYRAADGVLQVFTGLPDRPKAGPEISLDFEAGPLAVNDTGVVLAAAGGQLWRVSRGSRPVLEMSAGEISALAYFPNGGEAIAMDGLVYRRRGGDLVPMAEANSVTALQMSADGSLLFAASGVEVLRIELATGLVSRLECGVPVTALEPLAGQARFRINTSENEPLFVYDGDEAEPRVVFIPPLAEPVRVDAEVIQ